MNTYLKRACLLAMLLILTALGTLGCSFPGGSGDDIGGFGAVITEFNIEPNPASIGDRVKLTVTISDTMLPHLKYFWFISEAAGIDTTTTIPELTWITNGPTGEYSGVVTIRDTLGDFQPYSLSRRFAVRVND